MTLELNGVACEYEMHKTDSKDTVVFLHGWGGDLRSFAGAFRAVSEWGISCVNIAFPKTVPSDWGIYDYAALISSLITKLNITTPVLVGHSFGGRVAIILAARGEAKKLVLTDSAGLKPRFSLRKKLKIRAYKRSVKCGKPLDGSGSKDYNSLDPCMRPVFVRIVNTHLEKLLPYIRCKTLIFWGKNDNDTPMYMAKRLHRHIANSSLVVSDGGHYAYIDANYKFLNLLKSFLGTSSK